MKYLKTFETKLHQKLQYAIIDNDLDKVKKLIEIGADLDKKGEDGYTAPMIAVLNFHIIPEYAENKSNWIKTQDLILIELLSAIPEPDLYKKSQGMTFWDLLNQDAIDFMMKNFPEKYQEYELKMSAKKYNI